MIAPKPQQMQSRKERLKTLNLLFFIFLQGGYELEFFARCAHPDDLPEPEQSGPSNRLSINKGPIGAVISKNHLFSLPLNGAMPPGDTGQFTFYAHINPILGAASADNQGSIREMVSNGAVEYVGRRCVLVGYGCHRRVVCLGGCFAALPRTAGQQCDPNLWPAKLLPEV
jgi:hypothetical protein